MTEQTATQEQQNEQQITPEEQARLDDIAKGGRVADLDEAARKAAAEAAKPKSAQQVADEKAAEEQAKLKKDEEDETARKAAEEAEKNKEDWKKEWVQTGNDHADAAIHIMKSKGISPVEGNAIFAEAIESGDLTKVKWDVLEARLGDPSAFLLIKHGIQTYYDGEYAAQQELVNYAYEGVGGKDNWAKIQKWAEKESATDPKFAKDRAEWAKALKVGGFAGKAAVDAIKARYEGKHGTVAPRIERGDRQSDNNQVSDPLSRVDYFKALEKAGGDRAPKHVRDALVARREAGRKMGL